MKRICTHLLLAAAVCLALFVLAGCEDSSSGSASDSFGGLVSMTAEAETTAVSESRTTARLTEAATTAPGDTEPTVSTTTTTTEPTVVGFWALDSVVEAGRVYYKDTSMTPALSYRTTLQFEFEKLGKVKRIHPLYGYSEVGLWTYTDNTYSRVVCTFPYDTFFNPAEEPVTFCFESGNLFVRGEPGQPDYNYVRVGVLP